MELLFKRLQKTNIAFHLNLNDKEVVKTINNAVGIACRDVGNFASDDMYYFLSNTWKLLPEFNVVMRHTPVFRISNFHLALQNLLGFFTNLNTDLIFPTFRGFPKVAIVDGLNLKVRENFDVAITYMRCKILAVSVVAALAELTGGDVPVTMFLGEMLQQGNLSLNINDFVSSIEPEKGVELNYLVYEILRDGQEIGSLSDLKRAPMASYIYGAIGNEGIYHSQEFAVHPMDKDNARKLLASLPKAVVRKIGLGCAELAPTRRRALKELVQVYTN